MYRQSVYPEDGGGMFLQNFDNHLPPDYTVIIQMTIVWIFIAV